MVAPHCVLASGEHNFKQVNSPILLGGNISKGPITIEDDVLIGANSVILDGVTIQKGAVIGAGSIVTKDVNSYDIVAGNPAVIIGNRMGKYK